jgi:hypothetical protein
MPRTAEQVVVVLLDVPGCSRELGKLSGMTSEGIWDHMSAPSLKPFLRFGRRVWEKNGDLAQYLRST